jgi:hypothetical protein
VCPESPSSAETPTGNATRAFKIPRYVRSAYEYPLTVTGKVQEFVMREMMTMELAAAGRPPILACGIREDKSSVVH